MLFYLRMLLIVLVAMALGYAIAYYLSMEVATVVITLSGPSLLTSLLASALPRRIAERLVGVAPVHVIADIAPRGGSTQLLHNVSSFFGLHQGWVGRDV
jgi:hypothetical protein